MTQTADAPLTIAYRIRGGVSMETVAKAIRTLLDRHEVLRRPPADHGAGLLSLRAAGLAEAIILARNELTRSFDTDEGPLLRAVCVAIGANETLVTLGADRTVADQTSMTLLWREFRDLYDGCDLAPVQLGWSEFTARRQAWLSGEGAVSQRAFWRSRLDGGIPPWSPVSALATATTGHNTLTCDVLGRRGRACELAARLGTTEFAVLLAAFAAVMCRFAGTDRLVIGVPTSLRHGEFAGVVGPLSHDLALCLVVEPETTFETLVARVAAELLELQRNRELSPSTALGNTSTTRIRFAWPEQSTSDRPLWTGGEASEVRVTGPHEDVDLALVIRPGFTAELSHATGVVDAELAERLVRAFGILLLDALDRPSTVVGALRLMSDEETEQQAATINEDIEVYPDLKPIHVALERTAAQAPDAVAVESGTTAMTYGDLDLRAARLAGALRARGIATGQTVGICLDRSADLVVSLLAVLKAGAAFVPLDKRMPADRMAAITADAGVTAVITDSRCPTTEAALGVLLIDPGEQAATTALPDVSIDAPAYVYYTSGSTGRPKGVAIDHRCAAGRLEWLVRRYDLRPGLRLVQKTPLIFDVAIWEIFGPLATGATILLADPEAESDVAHIRGLLGRSDVVFTHFVPSMLRAYLDFAGDTEYPGLRWVQTSGEAVAGALLARFTEHFSVDLHNCYGQTETSEVAAWEGRFHDERLVPMGRQIGIYRLFVMDEQQRLVPPGAPGELCVSGVGGLATGYLGQPADTAQRFVPHPYAITPGERLYRTGDLAVADQSGVLHYLGRVDHQVKIRGARVETGEVEAVLRRHSGVQECAVLARSDESGDLELIAYLVGEGLSVSSVAQQAEQFLTTHMRPSAYVLLDALPIGPTGKLDRRALPDPAMSDRQARSDAADPASPLEGRLVGLWRDLLRVDTVGRTDNFFSLGGNSLKSLQVINRVKSTFGVEVSVRAFFEEPTVAQLAEIIERSLAESLAGLSDEDAARLLRAEEGQR